MDEHGLNQLRVRLLGEDLPLRAATIRTALEHPIETVSLIPDFYTLCRSGSVATASTAWAAIGRYESLAAPFLLKLMASHDPSDRRNAIELLLSLGFQRSHWRLAEQILSARPKTKPAWGNNREQIIQQLHRALRDDDADVRLLAATTLDEVGLHVEHLAERLAAGLQSTDAKIQSLSALHLGRLGQTAMAALPALQDFIESHPQRSSSVARPELAAKQALRLIIGKQGAR